MESQYQPGSTLDFEFDTVEAALIELKSGRAIVVVDDENRENEGDVICAAQFATRNRSISWPQKPGD